MNIIAYRFEADFHCVGCTIKRFHWTKKNKGNSDGPSLCNQYGISPYATDSEGNTVDPIVSDDYNESLTKVYLVCGDCHDIIDTYSPEVEVVEWQEVLLGYLEDGTDPGGFLTAILENNLTESVIRADVHNLILIPKIVHWLLTQAPRESWGSAEKVEAWVNKGLWW